jgi:YD repeat-containing protein
LDRLTSVVNNYVDGVFNLAVTDEDVTTEYRYDKVGNRTVITDARGLATTYVYNDLNQRIETRDPLGNTTYYGYDALGRQTVIISLREKLVKLHL